MSVQSEEDKNKQLRVALTRSIEVGDINFLSEFAENKESVGTNPNILFAAPDTLDKAFVEIIKEDNLGTWFPENSTLLYTAIANKNLEFAKYLLKLGAKINPEQPYRTHPLMFSIANNDEKMLDFLLQNGANIHYADRKKHTPLMYAVLNENISLVKKILAAGANISDTSFDGDNVFHLAASKNNEMLQIVLSEHPEAAKCMEAKNIYGHTPQDIQKMAKEDKWPTTINQMKIIRKMIFNLTIQYRDLDFLEYEGHCNGLEFIYLLRAKSENDEYFFSTLELIARWDGSQEKLLEPFGNIPQKKYYANLAQLFEQLITDMIIFQQNSKLNTLGMYVLQPFRLEQYLLHANPKDKTFAQLKPTFLLFETGTFNESGQYYVFNRTQEQQAELFKYFNRMPPGLQIELSGAAHNTSAHFNMLKNINYYDPNFKYKTTPADPQQIAQRILDYKYIRLKKLPDDLSCPISTFYFQKDLNHIDFNNAEILTEQEIPRDRVSAELFQTRSPNGFSPLHIAAMTHNVKLLKRLIQEGFCDPNVKDKDKRSPLVMAIMSHCETAALDFLDLELDTKDLPYALKLAYERNQKLVIDKILKKKTKIDLSELFNSAIKKKDVNLVKLLVEKYGLSVELEQKTQPYPLTIAIKSKSLEISQYLMERGADPFKIKLRSVNQTSAFEAISSNTLYNEELYKLMCDKYKKMDSLDEKGNAPIHYASQNHNFKALTYLLKNGANINFKNDK